MIRGGDNKFDFAGGGAAATATPSAKFKQTVNLTVSQLLVKGDGEVVRSVLTMPN